LGPSKRFDTAFEKAYHRARNFDVCQVAAILLPPFFIQVNVMGKVGINYQMRVSGSDYAYPVLVPVVCLNSKSDETQRESSARRILIAFCELFW
jgi:hypothetical protein